MIVLVGCAALAVAGEEGSPEVASVPSAPDLAARLVDVAAPVLLQGQRCLLLGVRDQESTVRRAARFLRHACRTTAVDHVVADVSPFRLAVIAHVVASQSAVGTLPGASTAAAVVHLVATSRSTVVSRSARRSGRSGAALRQRLLPPPRGSFYVVEEDGEKPAGPARTSTAEEVLAVLAQNRVGLAFLARGRLAPPPAVTTAVAEVARDADVTWTRRWGSDTAYEVVSVRAPERLATAASALRAGAWGCYWCGGRSPSGVVCAECGASKRPTGAADPETPASPIAARVGGPR